MKHRSIVCAALFVCTLLVTDAFGRAAFDQRRSGGQLQTQSIDVGYCIAMHRVNQLGLSVDNSGTFGTGFRLGSGGDCFVDGEVKSCEYPRGTNTQYLFAGAFWIGAVVGRDTVVSVGADGWSFIQELRPTRQPMTKRSIIDPQSPLYDGAVSEEDFIAVYTDTFTEGIPPDLFGQPHKPLQIEVVQNSFAWSYSYAEDFVLFDYQISNIGNRLLENVYMGLYVDGDVCYGGCDAGYSDDITGFLETYDRKYGDTYHTDTVFIAWLADNEGDLALPNPLPSVTGTRIIRTPAETLQVSFNWWISSGNATVDFGPRERPNTGRWKEPFRDFGTGGLGTPEGDRNKYYIMKNQEFDYDQAWVAAISPNDTLWLYPDPNNSSDWSRGLDTRYLLSFGPFTIVPGQTLPLSFAYVGGKNLHTVPGNLDNLPDNPEAFYENLDFSDLAENSTWASWIYDNPGVDTDSDGYAGEFFTVVRESIYTDTGGTGDSVWLYLRVDTNWTVGDGIPDFRGASPPPAPKFRLKPSYGEITVRFNGSRSETTKDLFTGFPDFEGYRVYIGRDDREASFSVVTSYDLEDYNVYTFDTSTNAWNITGVALSLQETRCLYASSCDDSTFHPLLFPLNRPFIDPVTGFRTYFEAQDFNQSELGAPDGIRKVYPLQPKPTTTNPDEADPDELTEDGLFKYYEYEYVIEDLLPTVSYWVNVTAFDYGSPESGLPALETSISLGAKDVIPFSNPDEVDQSNLKVVVYPNPYRIDADYRGLGFEGRGDEDRPDNRVRRINFANLPARCTIKIFTIDGDLVKEIEHDKNPADPNASYDSWDLITRNTQMIVSGLYYWTVESEGRETQVGKLAIIM
jgi:hypothetical protein